MPVFLWLLHISFYLLTGKDDTVLVRTLVSQRHYKGRFKEIEAAWMVPWRDEKGDAESKKEETKTKDDPPPGPPPDGDAPPPPPADDAPPPPPIVVEEFGDDENKPTSGLEPKKKGGLVEEHVDYVKHENKKPKPLKPLREWIADNTNGVYSVFLLALFDNFQ